MKHNTHNSAFTPDDTAIAKILAIMIMMFYHLFAFPKRLLDGVSYTSLFSLWGQPVEYQLAIYGKLCVAIFAFLSGYGMYLSFKRNPDHMAVISKRFRGLFSIYWKVFVVFIPIGIFLGVERIQPNMADLIKNFFAIDITYNGEWWFITPYLLTILMMPVFYRWYERSHAQVCIDILLISVLAMIISYFIPPFMELPAMKSFSSSLYYRTLNDLFDLLPPFLMGGVFAKYNLFQKFRDAFPNRLLLYPASFIVLIASFFLRLEFSREYDYLFAPMFILAVTTLLRDIPLLNRLLITLSKKNTHMWLIHSFYCYHFCQSFVFTPKYAPLIFLLLFVMSYISACVLDLIFILIKKTLVCFTGNAQSL